MNACAKVDIDSCRCVGEHSTDRVSNILRGYAGTNLIVDYVEGDCIVAPSA